VCVGRLVRTHTELVVRPAVSLATVITETFSAA